MMKFDLNDIIPEEEFKFNEKKHRKCKCGAIHSIKTVSCPHCDKKEIIEEFKLELKKTSWENLFEVIRNSKINSKGNFWASIQHLEGQFEEREKLSGENKL